MNTNLVFRFEGILTNDFKTWRVYLGNKFLVLSSKKKVYFTTFHAINQANQLAEKDLVMEEDDITRNIAKKIEKNMCAIKVDEIAVNQLLNERILESGFKIYFINSED